MPRSQVHHMEIIPAAGAIGGGVIIAEHHKAFPPAHRDLCDVRQQVIGDALRVLPDEAGGVRSDGIKIPQQHRRKGGIGMTGILQNLFDHGLGGTVGAGALPRGISSR